MLLSDGHRHMRGCPPMPASFSTERARKPRRTNLRTVPTCLARYCATFFRPTSATTPHKDKLLEITVTIASGASEQAGHVYPRAHFVLESAPIR